MTRPRLANNSLPAFSRHARPGRRNIYQSIFLDDSQRQGWTVDAIDKASQELQLRAAQERQAQRERVRMAGGALLLWSFLPGRPASVPCLSALQTKILKTRMTRQFAHTWRHFATWVPFVSARLRARLLNHPVTACAHSLQSQGDLALMLQTVAQVPAAW